MIDEEREWFVVDETRNVVHAGPFATVEAAKEAADGPSDLVATHRVLEMVELVSSTTLRWDLDDEADVVTGGEAR